MLSLKSSLSLLAIVLLVSCSKDEIANKQLIPQIDISLGKAPLLANAQNAKYIQGDYIVVFNDDVDVDSQVGKAEKAHGISAKYVYKYAIKGFAATLQVQALDALRSNSKVKYIEQDQEVRAITTQSAVPSWGIDRIDQQILPLSTTYSYTNDGSGVTAYVFDTGIRFDHVEFEGRAKFGFDAIRGGKGLDGNGHGTHVSGTIGGKNVGVAKKVTLVAVRVLNNNGSGTTSGVVAGLDWAVKDHATNPAVGNMSLGGGISTTLDNAVIKVINDGIVMCVAAGNSATDASTSSPARVSAAITVGATDESDNIAYYSNYGAGVDIFAPGSAIYSSWNNSSTSYNTISGTSMATPHVTGVAALYLQSNTLASPSTVQAALVNNAIAGTVKLSSAASTADTPNRLLFSSY